ncbi:MAG: pyruvate kinase [Campylobacterota bacterium]|nr:pyruvate kinase [Campylobacterota bacterium]
MSYEKEQLIHQWKMLRAKYFNLFEENQIRFKKHCSHHPLYHSVVKHFDKNFTQVNQIAQDEIENYIKNKKDKYMRKTKIVVTLGPATDNLKDIIKLIKKGVNVFRLNFSHATHEYHKELITKVRKASKILNKNVAILQDIAGPKIRISQLKKPIELKTGDILTITKNQIDEEKKIVSLSYPDIIDSLEVGDPVYFSDGTIRAKVITKSNDFVECKIIIAQTLQSKKGMNLPKSKLNILSVTQKDKLDLAFGAKNGVDLVALSFVSDAQDIKDAKKVLEKYGANPMIFAKIEKQEAIKNIKSILKSADGIMVARGDLGVELGLTKVPHIQKDIIKQAANMGKPTITATQMLTSMINCQYPTRAEISDIANAVLDGTDAVMLSDETTIGKHPLKAVEVLNNTINETEKDYNYNKTLDNTTQDDSIAKAATTLASSLKLDGIITFTSSGKSAISLSKVRPKQNIIVSSFDIATLRKLQVVWGINLTYLSDKFNDTDKLIKSFLVDNIKNNIISKNKKYVLTIGSHLDIEHSTNDIRVIDKKSINYLIKKDI